MVIEAAQGTWHVSRPLTFWSQNKNQVKSKSKRVGIYTGLRETLPFTHMVTDRNMKIHSTTLLCNSFCHYKYESSCKFYNWLERLGQERNFNQGFQLNNLNYCVFPYLLLVSSQECFDHWCNKYPQNPTLMEICIS